mgnify:CR=1 FL=1
MYLINELARLAGVSVRTLQYYDSIGLLGAAELNPAGYRLYGDAELDYLQQILLYKELGYSLKQIQEILYAPEFDLLCSLENQKKLIEQKIRRLDEVAHTIDGTIRQMKGGPSMKDSQRFKGIDVEGILKEQEQYSEELKERFDARTIEESNRRTAHYSKERWAQIIQEGADLASRVGDQMNRGAEATDEKVQEEVAKYHSYIDNNFYSCSIEVFRGLGEMYVSDLRFSAYYEKIAEGLAVFFSHAIGIYCDRLS